jgi:hypothetical protein
MSSRKALVQSRVEKLVANFPAYVRCFEDAPPFRHPGQLEHHTETIRLQRQLGSAAAIHNQRFVGSLYSTLNKWGIGKRRSKLVTSDQFSAALRAKVNEIVELDDQKIDDKTLDIETVWRALWHLIDSLGIVTNNATLVAGTKALHHILPSIVVPMDRKYTQTFFGWGNPEFQYEQLKVFRTAFSYFAYIAGAVNPAQYVGRRPWSTSPTKVIDNAIVGFLCVEEFEITS